MHHRAYGGEELIDTLLLEQCGNREGFEYELRPEVELSLGNIMYEEGSLDHPRLKYLMKEQTL